MEGQRRSLRLFLTVVMLFGVASSPLIGVRQVQAQAVSADEQFWARFATFVADMEAVVAANPKVYPAGFAAGVAQIRQRVSSLTADERAALQGAYSGNQSVWDVWKKVGPVLAQITSRPGHLMSQAMAGPRNSTAAFSQSMLSSDLSNSASVQATCPPDVDLETLLALKATVTATEGAYNILQSSEPDVFGVKVLSGIAAGVALAAQIAVDVLEFDQARADACNDDNHASLLGDVATNTDVKVSTRATQTSVDTLQATLQAHSTDITNLVNTRANLLENLVNLRANLLEGKLQTHDTDMKNLVTTRATFIDATLANVTAKMAVTPIEVIELKNNERFLLVTNEGGAPVNVELVSVKVSDLKGGGPLAFQDVTVNATPTPASLGVLDVRVDLPKALKDAKLFEFKVRHPHGVVPPLGNVDHFGIVVFVSK